MNIKKTEIIQTIKENYNRDLRKKVVKTILAEEKEKAKPNYQVINEILAYVLKELEWKMEDNTKEWDNTPLDIIEETFPKIESTKWFEELVLSAKKMIEMKMKS